MPTTGGERMPTQRWSLDATSQRVALTVLRHGPISRAELGRLLGLSSASVTRLTKPMVGAGLLTEGAPEGRSTGRPPLPLDIAADSATFVGLKISHEGLHAVLTDLRGSILATASCPGARLSPADVAGAVCTLVEDLGAGRPTPLALGASLGATVGPDKLVRGALFLGWDDGIDLAGLLEDETGLRTTIDNDVNAFTVAEHWFGVGKDTSEFAVLTIGAGVGLGLVCRDELVRGRAGAAGMIGPLRVLGGRLAQDVLNRDVFDTRAAALVGPGTPLAGLPALAAEVPGLGVLLDEVADAVGELAGTVAAITAPERVLVAGEGVPLLAGREDRVRGRLEEMQPQHVPVPELVVDVVGDDEWARGAAALAIRAHMGAEGD